MNPLQPGTSQSHPIGDDTALLLGSNDSQLSQPSNNWRDCFPEIIGRSPKMLKVLETVFKIARTESAVLIRGDSGTGKELIAAALHRLSKRSAHRFIAINCSAIPENLLESELFGHEKGSFTGALNRKKGHFELAAGGTLFLDEIGDMPARLQAKLLRVLQERQFMTVGGTELIHTDVRIIAATNHDLEKAVKESQFRLDLYYRLNVLPIELPTLKERSHDVPELLFYFLEAANRVHTSSAPCYFSQQAIEILSNYSWPGNVRELQNLVERLVIMKGGGEITIEALTSEFNSFEKPTYTPKAVPEKPTASLPVTVNIQDQPSDKHQASRFVTLPNEGIHLTEFIEQLENSLIMQALEKTNFNKNQAAKLLGLNRTTLVERIKKRQLAPLNPSQEL